MTNPATPEATPVYNVWIWLVVFLPYVTLPLLFTIDFAAMFGDLDYTDPNSSVEVQLNLLTSPGYLILVVGGFVTTAATLFAAYRDWRWLRAVGIPDPFHWAWSFLNLLSYPVYAIGRAVVTRRRTGKGFAVLWATIGMIGFGIVIVTVWSVIFVSSMLQFIATM